MTRPVTAADRLRDLGSVALLAGGVILYGYAHHGMRDLAAGRLTTAPGHWMIEHWNHFRHLADAGLALGGAGIAIGLWSYLRFARRPAPPAS